MMAEYTLEVTTGSMLHAGTFDNLYVTLIGTERQSERTHLTSFGLDGNPGKVGTYSVTTLFSLGCLLLLKLEKDPFNESPEKNWFCSKIVVKTPEEDEILFPCHRWLSSGEFVLLRGGRATKPSEDLHPLLVEHRKKELVQQKLTYKWQEYAEGLSYNINFNDPKAVPAEISYSYSKAFQIGYLKKAIAAELKLKNLTDFEHWESFEAMKEFSWFKNNPFSEYVSQHWKDDDLFGYQFINGVNPYIIQRCSKLPSNFPVTEEMVKPFLANGSSLATEMKKGNIFISDYKIMDGLPTRVIDGKAAGLSAALCLLYLNPEKKLLPIAIQLSQQPSEENPIFLPSDLESDWLLAKIFVRLADTLYSQLIDHLHGTHLLAEVFAVATLRNFPTIHPLHKLLIPHHRHTLHTNVIGRTIIYGPGSFFANSSLGEDGVTQLFRRGLSQTTYSCLCLPEDIAARGLESIPNFYYRDDALRLWNIINSFVKEIVAYYYPSDSEVAADFELQEWVKEIFYYGFLGNSDSGLPSSLQTVKELIKFVTVVIFTSSVQHHPVSKAQFDFQGWIPNGPVLLHQAPPTMKGQSSMDDILAALPTKYFTGRSLSILWTVSRKYEDFVPLGTYPEQRFEEPAALQMIKDFQAELSSLSVAITKRNSELELPYDYMNPKDIENSFTENCYWMTMAEYKLEVTTGDLANAGTFDHIQVILFGTGGESEQTELDNFGVDFQSGKTGVYTVKTRSSLGKLLLVKVEKKKHFLLPEDEWYCSKIMVTTPEGDVILFPCYRWISRGELVELRGGKATKVFEDEHPLLIDHRKKEVTQKKSFYQWEILDEGLPYKRYFDDASEIPAEVRFSEARKSGLLYAKNMIGIELKIKGLLGSAEKWENFEDMKKIFWFKTTTTSEYVKEHWKEDDFYGYQFLNSLNPNVIKRCSELPPNFAVTEEMVKPFLEKGSSLQNEMEKGNIFLYDQKKMDGIPGRLYNGEPLHATPGLCLFYLNQQNKLMPIAIQLHQQPSKENPVFLPSDPETDWLLAKMYIKNVDAMDHQSVHHLMNTHILAEVFMIATLRNFPVIHPLYKLLLPHFRFTLDINTGAHEKLLGSGGALTTSTLGIEGLKELMRRSLSEMTYSSLCLPENITARGLESIPNFYYRDDGLKLWNIINSFVRGIVEYYYPSDSEVYKDTELQDWISDIFTHGFLGNKASGFPQQFQTVEEVIKFITMVIFTVTGQHAAVNNGQYDHYAWLPNASLLLIKPPPTTKGQSNINTILETLPNVGETVGLTALAWLLSKTFDDSVLLGQYPEERFDEPTPKQMMKRFQAELFDLSEEITARNSRLELPYTYLTPTEIENSITV